MAIEQSQASENLSFVLPHRIAVYVPSTTDINQPINNAPYVKATLEILAKLCGGATAQEALGSYLADNGELVVEKVTIVWAGCAEIAPDITSKLYNLAKWIKTTMSQESVMVEVDHKIAFV